MSHFLMIKHCPVLTEYLFLAIKVFSPETLDPLNLYCSCSQFQFWALFQHEGLQNPKLSLEFLVDTKSSVYRFNSSIKNFS